MRASGTGPASLAAMLVLAVAMVAASPAAAGYPGSTQIGAIPIPQGNILVIRDVPPRNALAPGAGAALSVRPAPPTATFGAIDGAMRVLTDRESAAVFGGPTTGAGATPGLGAMIDSQMSSLVAGRPGERGAGAAGGALGGPLQDALGAMRGALGSLGTLTGSGR